MTNRGFSFSSNFSNNAVIIIDALGEADLQTAIHLRDALWDASPEIPAEYCKYFKVLSSSDLFAVLDEVCDQVKMGLKPIVHIEAHGDEHEGMLIAGSNEKIAWSLLLTTLRTINVHSGNNLGVVVASCFGLYLIESLSIHEPCPFFFLIGSDREVAAGEIDRVMKLFYLQLHASGSLDKAMNEVDADFKQFHAEYFFYKTFAGYMKRACMGAGAQRRLERLLTGVVERGGAVNRDSLRRYRAAARKFIRQPEDAFERYASRFLHGRNKVPFVLLNDFVRGNG